MTHDDTHAVEETGLRVQRRGPGWRQEGRVGYCPVCRRFLVTGAAPEPAPYTCGPQEAQRLNRAADRQSRLDRRRWLAAHHPRDGTA